MAEPIRVALCDDHTMVRSGLHRILAEEAGIVVVGEAGTADEAVQLARRTRPDVIVMDLGLPGPSGIAATGWVRRASPNTLVLVLTAHNDVAYLRRVFAAGASGYLLKEAADIELVQAVRTVASGRQYIYPTLGAAALHIGAGSERPTGPGVSCRSANWRCCAESRSVTPTPRSPPRCTCRSAPSRPTVPMSSRSSAPAPAPSSWNAHGPHTCSPMTSFSNASKGARSG